MKHPGIEALLNWADPGNPANCTDAESLFPGSHQEGLDMHQLNPVNPYNQGHATLGSHCQRNSLSGLGAQDPWYKSPLLILVGVGALYAFMTTSAR